MTRRRHVVKHAARVAPRQRSRYPLLPGSLRRLAVVTSAVCAAITALLAVLVHHQNGAGFMDRKIDHLLHRSIGRHHGLLEPLARLGDQLPVTLMAVVLVVACLLVRRWNGAVLVAVGVSAAIVVTEYLLKPLVDRTLGGGESFPSGHATGMFAVATAFSVLIAAPLRLTLATWQHRVLAVCAFLFAASVPVAMVGLNHHYFTDIVAGAAVGIAAVLVTALVLDWLGGQWGNRLRLAHDASTRAQVTALSGPSSRE
jgi:membrane-associated phospholipid phosphatase